MTEELPLTPIGRKVVEPSHRLSNEDWAKVVAEAAVIRKEQEARRIAEGDDDGETARRLGAGLLAPAPRKLAGPPVVNLLTAGRNSGKYFPVSGIPTQLVVFHSMECPLQGGYARSLTHWALTPLTAGGPQASWHRGYGPDERVYFIPDELGAWHASEANVLSIGLEQTGYAAYTRAQWLTADGIRMLDGVAVDVAAICKRDGIPARWLTTAEVRAVLDGGNRSIKGFCFHRQVDPETRTDPGNGYPADVVLTKIKALLSPAAPPAPPKDEFDMATLQNLKDIVLSLGWAYRGKEGKDAWQFLRDGASAAAAAKTSAAAAKTSADAAKAAADKAAAATANLQRSVEALTAAVKAVQQPAAPAGPPVTPPAS